MDGDVRVANHALVYDRAKRKFSCNLLLLPRWLDRMNLEIAAEKLALTVCDLGPQLERYLKEDHRGHLTCSRLLRLLKESGRATGHRHLLVIGMDRALALLSPPDARSMLYKTGGGSLWQWQAGDGRYYLIPWLEITSPPYWPTELCMWWEGVSRNGQ